MSAAAVVQAAVVVADVINTVVSAADRRKFQEGFAMFSEDEQINLAQQIQAAKTQDQKIDILANAFYQHTIQEKKNQVKKQTVQYIFLLGGTLAIAFIGFLIYKKNH